jgi:dTDP-4-amino-4,6-dideoxygalactose transaminase
MIWKIPLADLDFGIEESAAVQNVLQSKWLTMGAVTQDFEQAFAKFTGIKHTIAVTNGTAALHLACVSIGLGAGDEVIVPSLSFVATANAVRYTGATPVFADIVSQNDLNISPAAIEGKITGRTKAIMVMHYGGYPCDMPEITALAEKYSLKVIEDAAHAVGSILEGKNLGGWGDVGCFSFFPNKNMTTGEGGMVTTNHDEIAAKLRLLRSHGMTSLTWDRHQGHARGYDVVELGYNYRIDEIRSALGLNQLNKLENNNKRRRQLTEEYFSVFCELVPEVTLPFMNYRGVSAAHILPVLLPAGVDRNRVMEHLKNMGIQSSNHYPPIHLFSIYRPEQIDDSFHLPITEDVAERQITLPLYPSMTSENVFMVVNGVREALHID